jgi:hypothetical protein
MTQNLNPSPTTYLVKTVNGVRRTYIYYDPDIFTEQIIISASLLIGDDDSPWDLHYNTVHDEDTGVSGTEWKTLDEIAIPICPLPEKTEIIGNSRVNTNTSITYKVSDKYDLENNYTYNWEVDGNVSVSGTSGKTIDITFLAIETVHITLEITNPCGCKRIIKKDIYPGTFKKNLLVLRNSYI